MKGKLKHIAQTKILFLFLLPPFFVLHGFVEFYDLIPVKESIVLTGFYEMAAILLFGLSWVLFKNIYKSALLSFVLLAYYFFFGAVQDWLKDHFNGLFFIRYSFILPVSIIAFIVLIILLKKNKKIFSRLTLYLNVLFVILLATEIIRLSSRITNTSFTNKGPAKNFVACPDCSKPDIYYILADEYAGKKELNELLKFDNSQFESELKERGFHIIEPSLSNYNYTLFSSPSILNMDYISNIEGYNRSTHDKRICNEVMKNNAAMRFFKQQGYQIYNYSYFDIQDQPTLAISSLLSPKLRPIISQTFFSRLKKDLWYHVIIDLKLGSAKRSSIYSAKRNNDLFIKLTKQVAATQSDKPKFVYSHILMPHFPYYYDKNGHEIDFKYLSDESDSRTDLYLGYLQYANKIYLDLIDTIKKNSRRPCIIIFLSDHGFKSFPHDAHPEYHCYNFNSILLPDSNYAPFYNGISNVNMFRVLLNSQFKQKLPLLKDSISIVRD